jgi:murein DD-endopeptidase MepM/ murein hydrolase activator NlpD
MKKQAAALERQKKGAARLAPTLLPAVVLWALSVSLAHADFFRYTGEDGVEIFTNTPTNGSAVRILREPTRKAARKHETPPQPATEQPQFGDLEPYLPVKGIITSKVGYRHDPIDGTIRHHNGIDIAVPVGTTVKAIAAGTVLQSAAHGGYGNLVEIDHGDGMRSLYGHNSQLQVKAGDRVSAGQVIALSGSTGRSTGPHLHFELWKNGVNVTEGYLKTGANIPEVAGGIRSYLHSDGSLVFTNY